MVGLGSFLFILIFENFFGRSIEKKLKLFFFYLLFYGYRVRFRFSLFDRVFLDWYNLICLLL